MVNEKNHSSDLLTPQATVTICINCSDVRHGTQVQKLEQWCPLFYSGVCGE